MAEEMERDRKKAFELQGKLEKSKKETEKHTKKAKEARKVRLPDQSEPVDKRAAKLEELLKDALEDIQVCIPSKVLLLQE